MPIPLLPYNNFELCNDTKIAIDIIARRTFLSLRLCTLDYSIVAAMATCLLDL